MATWFGKDLEHSSLSLLRVNLRSCLHVDVFLPSSQLLKPATALQIQALAQARAVRKFGSSSSPGVKAEKGAALSKRNCEEYLRCLCPRFVSSSSTDCQLSVPSTQLSSQ